MSEIDARFGQMSETRRVQMDSVQWMVELALRTGVRRIVLNGSFVTDIMEPNDVDCVLLATESTKDSTAEAELLQGLPFLEILLVGPEDLDELINVTFATDRFRIPKGMIEVAP